MKNTIDNDLSCCYEVLGKEIESITVEDEEGNFIIKLTKDGYTLKENYTIKIQTEMIEFK